MEKMKDLLGLSRVKIFAAAFEKEAPGFSSAEFLAFVRPRLPALEMKERVKLLSKALALQLPKNPGESFPLLLKVIRTEKNPRGLENFLAWPLTQFVEDFGMDDWKLSLKILKRLTPVMSAEFAIRPFLLRYHQEILPLLEEWAQDPDPHVRRLVSEGTRPRLPWGQRLPHFLNDPEICVGLLRSLRTDDELYVRKSVANHLNDISKDNPDWLLKELQRWQKECPDHAGVQWILRHACRTLLKAGHSEALSLHGYQKPHLRAASLKLKPAKVTLGGKLSMEFKAEALKEGDWLVDYCVHHRKGNGKTSPKVFKWAIRKMKKGDTLTLSRSHPIKPISTRRYYSGAHEVEILVNGQVVARHGFSLQVG